MTKVAVARKIQNPLEPPAPKSFPAEATAKAATAASKKKLKQIPNCQCSEPKPAVTKYGYCFKCGRRPAKSNVLQGEQLDLLPKEKPKTNGAVCICGKPGQVYSGLHGRKFCSERCIELTMQNGKGIGEAKIKIAANGTAAYYEQADLVFPVDPKDLNKVVDGNREGSPIDKLMDSQILTLAQANGLPVVPFVRSLLRPVLIGVLQMVWYRDVERREISEHLKENQLNRVKWYTQTLRDWHAPAKEAIRNANGGKPPKAAKAKVAGGGKTAEERAQAKGAALTQTIKLKKMPKDTDLPKQAFILCEVLKEKGGKLALADFLNASEGRIVTKQGVSKIFAFYRTKLQNDGFIEVGA